MNDPIRPTQGGKDPDEQPLEQEQEKSSSGFTSFWNELKRRKVVRVAVVYAVVAWLLIQVAATVFPQFNIPAWGTTLVTLLLVIGFPIALIFAWVFDVTSEGIRADAEVRSRSRATDTKGHRLNYITLGLVVLVLTFLVVDRYLFDTPRMGGGPRVVPTQGDRPAVAGTINLPDSATLASGAASTGVDGPLIAISPDSAWLIYVGRDETGSRLYRRHLKSFDGPEPIPGTEGAIHPFFSPDGQSIGFLTNDRLKRLSIEGDDLRTLATTSNAIRGRWTKYNWVYYTDATGNILRRVPDEGGEVETVFEIKVTRSGIIGDVLPDGQFAFATQRLSSESCDFASIILVDLNTGERKPLGISGYDARWISTGHLVFGRSGNLMAVRFDPERMRILGEPVPLIRDIAMDSSFGIIQYAVSSGGTLAYIPGSDRALGSIAAIDRQGIEKQLPDIPLKRFNTLSINKDQGALAVQVFDVKDYIWIYDLNRQEGRKLAGSDGYSRPKWGVYGNTLAMTSLKTQLGYGLMTYSIDGANAQVVYTSPEAIGISDWSPDGNEFALHSMGRIGFLSTGGEDPVRWMDKLPDANLWGPVFSPDGRWIAYNSNESGRSEVWVCSYPDGKVRRQVSVNGGNEPVWTESGEIFFRRKNQIYFSRARFEPELVLEPERLAFTAPGFLDTVGCSYDVSSDGQTLYFVKSVEPAIDDRIHVIGNWFEELERLVPSQKGVVSSE